VSIKNTTTHSNGMNDFTHKLTKIDRKLLISVKGTTYVVSEYVP